MLNDLRAEVCRANHDLVRFNLVTLTFGNVSGIDRAKGIIAIKPSGVGYDELTPKDMVLLDLDGKLVEKSRLAPSSDTPTHLVLYRAFKGIGGITHTHSPYASMFAQAGRAIPPLGTTHADHFNGEAPVTRGMTRKEVEGKYEENTGRVIVERFKRIDPVEMPAVLVRNHGPFTWGKDAAASVHNSVALELVAKMALGTFSLDAKSAMPGYLLTKHFTRKHGPGAYYGQRPGK